MFSYDYANASLTNINVDIPQTSRLKHRRSLDYGSTNNFSLAGPNKCKTTNTTATTASRHYSIPSSPSQLSTSHPVNATCAPRNMIFIRRQSSEKCLQKRHSMDSNNSNTSDPGYSSNNNKTFLCPSQQRSPRESNSPKSCHSSVASVLGRNSSCSSMAFLSRQSSVNSSKLARQRQSDENLDHHKWFSSSSVILTRVKSMKEKFRRVVVQSVQPDDWPPPSVLFSDRYRCPSTSSTLSTTTTTKTPPISHHTNPNLVKSKSIDPSSFPMINGRKVLRNFSSAGSGRYCKRERLQRSLTSYTGSIDHGNGSDNGIVCSDMDLKAIISTFKKEYNNNGTIDETSVSSQNGSKTPIGTSSVMGPGFGKRKLMRKQVSFDDEQGVMMINRKVSAIAEEIECHTNFENVIASCAMSEEKSKTDKELPCDPGKSEEEEENCAPRESLPVALLPKEIEFDEYGQTWEIYGADPDPEILGQAIQHHLERLMVCRQVVTTNIPNGSAVRPSTTDPIVTAKITGGQDISDRLFKPLRVDLQSTPGENNNLRFFARRLCGKWSCFSSGNRDQSGNNTVMTSIDITR